jgi:hypothetical protein
VLSPTGALLAVVPLRSFLWTSRLHSRRPLLSPILSTPGQTGGLMLRVVMAALTSGWTYLHFFQSVGVSDMRTSCMDGFFFVIRRRFSSWIRCCSIMTLPIDGGTSCNALLVARMSGTLGFSTFGGDCPSGLTLLIRRMPLIVVAGWVCTFAFFNLFCKGLDTLSETSPSCHA